MIVTMRACSTALRPPGGLGERRSLNRARQERERRHYTAAWGLLSALAAEQGRADRGEPTCVHILMAIGPTRGEL